MTRELLSSRWTAAYRVGLPAFWIGGGVAVALALHASGLNSWIAPLGVAWVAGLLPVLWIAGSLVHVSLEGDTLFVASRSEVLPIPLRDVERVSGTRLLDPELVWIRLRRPGALGSRLLFVPRRRGFLPFAPHPVVKRLEALIAAHEAPGLPPPLEAGATSGGSLRALVLVAVALLVVGALVLAGIASLVRSANPYRAAIEVASSHPQLVALLGEPIRAGWPEDARLEVDGDRAEARFEIPLAGPRGGARLYVRSSWRDGEWSFSRLEAALPDGRSLDLLASGPAPPDPPGELL